MNYCYQMRLQKDVFVERLHLRKIKISYFQEDRVRIRNKSSHFVLSIVEKLTEGHVIFAS